MLGSRSITTRCLLLTALPKEPLSCFHRASPRAGLCKTVRHVDALGCLSKCIMNPSRRLLSLRQLPQEISEHAGSSLCNAGPALHQRAKGSGFFLSKHQRAPCQKAAFRQASRTWLVPSAENWPDESKAGGPLPGEDRSGRSSWAPARARGAAGARVTTGSPSRFLWLLLGRSFDLFLTGSAEKPGIALLARQWGSAGSAPLATAASAWQGWDPHHLLHLSWGKGPAREGGEAANSSASASQSPWLCYFFIFYFFNHIKEGCVCFFISGCCVPWGPLAAAPLFVSRKSFPNPSLAEKSSNRL